MASFRLLKTQNILKVFKTMNDNEKGLYEPAERRGSTLEIQRPRHDSLTPEGTILSISNNMQADTRRNTGRRVSEQSTYDDTPLYPRVPDFGIIRN